MRGILILLGSGLLLCATAANSQAASATISWNASTSSNAAGYLVYYGNSSGNYITAVLVANPNATNVTINGLTSGATYYFAAASYDNLNDISGLSPEISGIVGSTSSSGAAILKSLPTSAAGQFGFTVSGVSNGQYIVQASTDLVHWVSLQTNTSPFNFVDPNAGQFSHRFYRAAYIPN